MIHVALILSSLLALAGGVQAQGEEKPALAPPEPKRQTNSAKPFVLTRLVYGQGPGPVGALPELVKYFRKATTIQTPVECNALSLGDPRLAETSLLYITSSSSPLDQLGEFEKKKLGEFLQRGGLIFAEQTWLVTGDYTPLTQPFKALMKDPLVLGPQGAPWQDIPNRHPLNSSFFDFHDGPPLSRGDPTMLQMLELRGRVAAIFSSLGLSGLWGAVEAENRETCLRYGVNLIVFGMTQRTAGAPLSGRQP